MSGSLEGITVKITLELTGWFETLIPISAKTVTIGSGVELEQSFSSRILSVYDSSNIPKPVPGPNGLLTGTLKVDISDNAVFAQFSGQAQPAGFKITIENLAPVGVAPGTVAMAGQMNGVNIVNAPTYSAQTKVLKLDWMTLGFQPGTVINQTVFYDNKLQDAPIAANDIFAVDVGKSLTGANILANDKDLDNLGSAFGIVDTMTVTQINGVSFTPGSWIDLSQGGQITMTGDGKLQFRDDGDFKDLARGVTRATSFEYTVSDSTGLTSKATATINVTGVNTAPSLSVAAAITTSENSNAIAVSGLQVSDVDGDGQTVSLSAGKGALSLGSTAGLTGDLNGTDGTLSFSGSLASVNAALASLSYRPTPNKTGTDTLNVQTKDANATVTSSIGITIADVAPVLSAKTVQVAENSANGTEVPTNTVTGDTNGLTYSILSGNTSGAFAIDASTGLLTVADTTKLNFETTPSFVLEIGVDDEDADLLPNSTASVTINLTDVNENPTGIALSTTTVAQSAAKASAVIATLSGTDPDAGSTLAYALVSGAGDTSNNKFVIDGETLKAQTDLAAGTYNVRVRTTDDGNLSLEKAVTITVTDDVGPSVLSISAPDAALKIGDAMTVTITAGEAGLSLHSATVNGKALTGFTDKGNGTYTATYTVAEGDISRTASETIPVEVVLKDAAGNLSAPYTSAIDNPGDGLDATRPAAAVPALTAASDTGLSSTDGLTNASTQIFTGTGEDGVTVKLMNGQIELASTFITGGSWSASTALSEGLHTITAIYTDPAGNSATSLAKTVTIDQTGPTALDDAGNHDLRSFATLLPNAMTNDTDAVRVVAVGNLSSNLGKAIAGTTGGSFTVAADGGVTFDAGNAFDALTSGETAVTQVAVTVSDAAGNEAASNYSVTVTGRNDAPVLAINKPLALAAGTTGAITGTLLKTADMDSAASSLEYTVTAIPAQGKLKVGSAELQIGGTFTQADIDAGLVQYAAGASAGAQSFEFSVSDGGTDGAAAISGNTFSITVGSPPAPPSTPSDPTPPVQPSTPQTTIVDGVPVTTVTTTDPNGTQSQTITIPTVTTPNNAPTANIPLVKNTDGSAVLSVAVPAGVGLTVSGATAPTSVANSSSQLTAQITNQFKSASPEQANLIEQGTKFLADLPAGSSVLVQTIVPTLQPGSGTSDKPLVISGTAGTSSTVTAVVLDASALPPGTVIELKNVAFAAVVGNVSLTGGEGSQTVFADNGSQFIFLGADDDILHGGGGDDTIGSAGGDDRIFGEAGNDVVFGGSGKNLLHGGSGTDSARYSGTANDYVITQKAGVVTVVSKSDPTQIDTLVNVEKLVFDNGSQDIGYDANLQWIAGLYKQVFARQADIGGIQAWAEQNKAGLSAGVMAMAFLGSKESQDKKFVNWSSDGKPTLKLLYEALLHRDADPAGLAFWQGMMDKGANLSDIAAGFVLSPEMQANYNMAPTQWDFIV